MEIIEKIKDFISDIDFDEILDKIKPIFSKIFDFFKKLPNIFVSIILMFTVMFDPAAGNSDTAILVDEKVKTMLDAVLMGQGITNDGEYFYTSGSLVGLYFTALAKFDIDTLDYVTCEINPLPEELTDEGFDHIGGISYYNGKIYAGVECSEEDENGFMKPAVVVFDAESLEYETHYTLPTTWFPDGLPWVAVDPQTGYLYTSMWDDAPSIHVFDVNATMGHVKEIDICGDMELIDRIQGGEFYEGKLYLSHDVKHTDYDEVLVVDPETGETKVAFTRQINKEDTEAEDLTICLKDDGSLFHVLDYNKLISAYVRSYVMVEQEVTE